MPKNVHDEYFYSLVLNHQNLSEVNKLGMVIELDTINPALIRYSRIYCHILEYASPIKNTITTNSNENNSGHIDTIEQTYLYNSLPTDQVQMDISKVIKYEEIKNEPFRNDIRYQ